MMALLHMAVSGADPRFQVRGGPFKIFGVFRVKNHDFTPKNLIFSNLWGAPGSTPGSREFRMHMKIPAQTGSGCICFNDLKIKQATFADILVQFV